MEYIREEVKAGLTSAVATVTFEKADGTIRVMRCTLLPQHLPEQVEGKKSHSVSEETLSVWDIENGGWRSFRLDSIKNIVYGEA